LQFLRPARADRKEKGFVVSGTSKEIVPFKEPRSLAGLSVKPPDVILPDEKTADCFFGFFTANHQNKNTRRAYYKAACRFSN
jgi:hypothetical protein